MSSRHSGRRPATPSPIEGSAYFSIDDADGYVKIDQSIGEHSLYTPEEARDIAEAIVAAADAAADDRHD